MPDDPYRRRLSGVRVRYGPQYLMLIDPSHEVKADCDLIPGVVARRALLTSVPVTYRPHHLRLPPRLRTSRRRPIRSCCLAVSMPTRLTT